MKQLLSIWIALWISGLAGTLVAVNSTHRYITHPPIEPDKCISAWLIKRHVDLEAVFDFIARGVRATNGIPFDIPGSSYLRNHKMCASETVVQRHRITNPKALALASLARKLEIGFWCAQFDETEKPLADALLAIWRRDGNPQADLAEGLHLLDQWEPTK